MARSRIILGTEYFPDWRVGRPLALADIYIGDVDLDPEILANRKTVYVIQQDGTEVAIPAASQPLSTGAGGTVLYLNAPVQLQTDDAYSIKILDSNGAQVYYFNSVVDDLEITANLLQAAQFYPNDPSSVSNAYVVIPPISPLPTSLVDGQLILFRPSDDSSGPCTINVIGGGGPIGAKALFLPDGISDPPSGYYRTTRDYCCRYVQSGDHFQDVDYGLFSNNPSIQVWNQNINYPTVPSYVTGSDLNLYKSILQSGPDLGGSFDPISDGGVHWTLINENQSITNNYGHIYGLALSNGTDATNDINISTGTARDSTNLYDLNLNTAIVKQIDAVWAHSTNSTPAGGFPSGLSAGAPVDNTWYSFWIIGKTDGTVDCGFDSAANGVANNPALLLADATGYTLFRRIGWIRYGTATIIKFFQVDNDFILDVPSPDFSGAPSTSQSLKTLLAPPDIYSIANISVFWSINVTDGNTRYGLVQSTRQTNTVPSASAWNLRGFSPVAGGGHSYTTYLSIPLNASSEISTRFSSTDTTLSLSTLGWIDKRGAY